MKRFTKQQWMSISEEVAAAAAEVLNKHGLTGTLKGLTYSDSGATIKVEASVVTDEGIVMTREARTLMTNAYLWGFKPSILGAYFESNGRTFKVTGARRTARVRPIVATSNGKEYCFPAEIVYSRVGPEHRIER